MTINKITKEHAMELNRIMGIETTPRTTNELNNDVMFDRIDIENGATDEQRINNLQRLLCDARQTNDEMFEWMERQTDGLNNAHCIGALLRKQRDEMKTELTELYSEYATIENERNKLTDDAHAMATENGEMQTRIETIENERDELRIAFNDMLRNGVVTLSIHERTQQQLKNALNELKTKNDQLQNAHCEMHMIRKQLRDICGGTLAEYDFNGIIDAIESMNDDIDDTENELAKRDDALRVARKQLQNALNALS